MLSKVFIRSISSLKGNPQVYVHKLNSHTSALSFFKDPAKLTIGQIPTEENQEGQLSSQLPTSISSKFKVTPGFLPDLQKTIKETIHNDMTFLMESEAYTGQNMPIYDLRAAPEYQRIPEIEDTFGFVAVDDKGKMIEGSYQVNNFYKPISADGKVIQLSEDLLENFTK